MSHSLILRYLNHLSKLIDAVHILTSTQISLDSLQKANEHLTNFVEEFEEHYGEENMVYNVHLMQHLVKCAEVNGPLFTYSNYCFEDYIGHLVSLVKGTTDVTTQLCERYSFEKRLEFHLKTAPVARSFHNHIESKLSHPIARKINGSLVIGRAKQTPTLNEIEIALIRSTLKIPAGIDILEYSSMMLDCKIFYESVSQRNKKRTCDTFVLNSSSGNFAEIQAIFLVNDHVYVLLNEKYQLKNEWNCEFVTELEEMNEYEQHIIDSSFIGPKHVLVNFNGLTACSRFPNMFERN